MGTKGYDGMALLLGEGNVTHERYGQLSCRIAWIYVLMAGAWTVVDPDDEVDAYCDNESVWKGFMKIKRWIGEPLRCRCHVRFRR